MTSVTVTCTRCVRLFVLWCVVMESVNKQTRQLKHGFSQILTTMIRWCQYKVRQHDPPSVHDYVLVRRVHNDYQRAQSYTQGEQTSTVALFTSDP